MGFLRRNMNQEEPDQGSDNEELYERMFPKIGRDFVYKEDLQRMMTLLMSIIDPFGLTPIDLVSDVSARKRALEYKLLLESGIDGSKIYRDLINLDDD